MFPETTFSLQSKFTDSLLATGGSGAGVVEFTLTYTWAGLVDIVTYGVPFSYQVDDFLSGGGSGLNPSNETTTLSPALLGSLALLFKCAINQRTHSRSR